MTEKHKERTMHETKFDEEKLKKLKKKYRQAIAYVAESRRTYDSAVKRADEIKTAIFLLEEKGEKNHE